MIEPKIGLDVHAYCGGPAGYPRSDFPDAPELLRHRAHWSYDRAAANKTTRLESRRLFILSAVMFLASRKVEVEVGVEA